MGATDSKVMVSTPASQRANGISTGKSQKTRSAKVTSALRQTDGAYARTESPPRNRDQGCQAQDFDYTGGACTAVGRCTKEELMAELASFKSCDERGEMRNGSTRPSILASYKPFDETDVNPHTEKKKRFGLAGRGISHERVQQVSRRLNDKKQMVEYASATEESQNSTVVRDGGQTKSAIPSARIQLTQAKTTNRSSTSTNAKQQTAAVIESHVNVSQHTAGPSAAKNTNASTTQNQTDEKMAQKKLLTGLFKKGAERAANAKTGGNKPTPDGNLTSAGDQTQNEEGNRKPAGLSLTKLDIDENREGDKEEKEAQLPLKKEGSGREARTLSTKGAPTEETQRAGRAEDLGKLFGRTASATNASQKAGQPADQKNALKTVVSSSTAVEIGTAATQNASKKKGFGRSTQRPMNRSNTIGYTLTTESTSDRTAMAQNLTGKESSTKTVEYSLTTTESSTKEVPKRKLFGRAKTIDEPETTSRNEGRTKLFGRIGQSHNVSSVAEVSGAQHQTVESHTTTTAVAGHIDDAQNPSNKEAPAKGLEPTSKKVDRTKLFGRIGQSYNVSTTSGNQKEAVESRTATSTVESGTTKATVAGHTEESVTTSKKEGRTKLFGRIGQSYNVSATPGVSGNQKQLFGRIGQSSNTSAAAESSSNQHKTVETLTATSTVEDDTSKTTIIGHTEGSEISSKKEGRSKLFGRIGQSYNVSTAPGAQHKAVESHTATTVESRTSLVTVEGHTNGTQNLPQKEAPTTATQRANRNEGFGKLFGRTGQSAKAVTTTEGSTASTTVETHTSASVQPEQPTSPSGLVSYSASTDSQRPRNKAGIAKLLQGRANAKTTRNAN
ncbi:hypothetical protein TcWFU_001455 [Taenia crassiceps]|uniref:Uncharacterized protein n=1 Tax=Taenia crassiceps TaxID=6207 RepID=A0ABR4QAI4_9CEST